MAKSSKRPNIREYSNCCRPVHHQKSISQFREKDGSVPCAEDGGLVGKNSFLCGEVHRSFVHNFSGHFNSLGYLHHDMEQLLMEPLRMPRQHGHAGRQRKYVRQKLGVSLFYLLRQEKMLHQYVRSKLARFL